MAWISLTLDDVLRSLTEPERDALQTAATDPSQADPVEAALLDVVREIRGYVAACDQNTLGTGDTIPAELKNAALSRARYEAFTRLPVGRSLLTEDRVQANKDAIALLRDCAACKFRIEQPAVPSTADVGSASPSVGTRTRTFARSNQDGL